MPRAGPNGILRGAFALFAAEREEGYLGTGADAAQTAQNADGRRVAAGGLASGAGDADLDHVCAALRSDQRIDLHIGLGVDGFQIGLDSAAVYGAAVEDVKNFNYLLDEHFETS